MPSDTRREVGRRIAAARRARRMTQPELAAAAHLSLSMLRKVEQGSRVPGDGTLGALATALGVDASRLIEDPIRTGGRVRAVLPALSAAIAAYDMSVDTLSRPLIALEQEAAQAEAYRLGARYARLATVVTPLVTEAIAAVHGAPGGPDRRRAARLLVSAARSADAVAYKFGARDLSARLIEVMRWAAPKAEDPLLLATVGYVRTETFFTARAYRAGLRALEDTIDQSPDAVCLRSTASLGALHMRAAVIAGRAGDADAADTHLRDAERLAGSVREGVYGGTAFGPASVRVHRVSVAVSLGGDHSGSALHVSEAWRAPEELPAERRSGYHIELARAQLWAGRADHAFESLQEARRIAPQHTREHPWARETALTLRRLRRADAEALTSFAKWIGAI
ncbi:multiprotein-bridging factor 1 family protein [Streptomyces sp. NPDC101145]|uniref:helix-turn-helix domain-containing protein n=1 Tax=Streptomyces sp. NPDC101145 TaxID=3366112 RepID=UPI003803FA77